MSHVCEKCIELKAQLIRSEEKRLRDKVTYQVKLASAKHKVRPEAEEDLIARVLDLGEWKEDKSGRVVLHKGGLAVLTRDGYGEMTPDSAVVDLRPVAPHLNRESDDGDDKRSADGANPWVKGEHWNMTKQGELFLRNPEHAKKLAAAAGIVLRD
jgi:hypothetical protein